MEKREGRVPHGSCRRRPAEEEGTHISGSLGASSYCRRQQGCSLHLSHSPSLVIHTCCSPCSSTSRIPPCHRHLCSSQHKNSHPVFHLPLPHSLLFLPSQCCCSCFSSSFLFRSLSFFLTLFLVFNSLTFSLPQPIHSPPFVSPFAPFHIAQSSSGISTTFLSPARAGAS